MEDAGGGTGGGRKGEEETLEEEEEVELEGGRVDEQSNGEIVEGKYKKARKTKTR